MRRLFCGKELLFLTFKIDTCTTVFVACKKTGSGNVSRMLGIYFYICHFIDNCNQHHIPLFGRIFVDAHFHTAENIDLGRQSEESGFEFLSHLFTLFGSTGQFERNDMFYHNYII